MNCPHCAATSYQEADEENQTWVSHVLLSEVAQHLQRTNWNSFQLS